MDLYSASSLTQQPSAGRHVAPHYPDSGATSFCSCFSNYCAQRRSSKYQFYSLRFDSKSRSTTLKVNTLTITTPILRGGFRISSQGRAHLKKIASSGGRREIFWCISCEKSRFYAKKSYFFQFQGGARAGCAPPPWIRPCERYKFTYLLVRELRKQVTLNECHLNIFYSIFYCNVANVLRTKYNNVLNLFRCNVYFKR